MLKILLPIILFFSATNLLANSQSDFITNFESSMDEIHAKVVFTPSERIVEGLLDKITDLQKDGKIKEGYELFSKLIFFKKRYEDLNNISLRKIVAFDSSNSNKVPELIKKHYYKVILGYDGKPNLGFHLNWVDQIATKRNILNNIIATKEAAKKALAKKLETNSEEEIVSLINKIKGDKGMYLDPELLPYDLLYTVGSVQLVVHAVTVKGYALGAAIPYFGFIGAVYTVIRISDIIKSKREKLVEIFYFENSLELMENAQIELNKCCNSVELDFEGFDDIQSDELEVVSSAISTNPILKEAFAKFKQIRIKYFGDSVKRNQELRFAGIKRLKFDDFNKSLTTLNTSMSFSNNSNTLVKNITYKLLGKKRALSTSWGIPWLKKVEEFKIIELDKTYADLAEDVKFFSSDINYLPGLRRDSAK